MSPEFNFHIKMNLPSKEIAKAVALELEKNVGVGVLVVDREQTISEKEQKTIAGLSFAQTLRYLRQREGLSQTKVSQLARISLSHLNRMEHEKTGTPRLSTVFKLLKSLDIGPSDPRFDILIGKLPSTEKNNALNLLRK